MRYAFLGLILCVCGAAFGGEPTSVMVSDSAPAPTPATTIVESPCVARNACCCNEPRQTVLTRTRYRVVQDGCDACTGRPVRSVARGVVRGTGEVIEGVGAAAVNVITLPGRICRGNRCSCN